MRRSESIREDGVELGGDTPIAFALTGCLSCWPALSGSLTRAAGPFLRRRNHGFLPCGVFEPNRVVGEVPRRAVIQAYSYECPGLYDRRGRVASWTRPKATASLVMYHRSHPLRTCHSGINGTLGIVPGRSHDWPVCVTQDRTGSAHRDPRRRSRVGEESSEC